MTNYLAASLKRLHDDCHRVIEDKDAQYVGQAIVDRYNELLEKVQDEYPDNDIIQKLDEVGYSGTEWISGKPAITNNDIQEVKFGVTSIADSIGLSLDDFEKIPEGKSFHVIEINQIQNQAQQQTATQSVTVEQLNEHVDGMMASEQEKEKLRELIERFEEELERDDPNKIELRDVIDSARAFSKQLGMKMAMAAFERGIDVFLE